MKSILFILCFLIPRLAMAATYTETKSDLINGVWTTQNLLKNPTAQKNLQYWTASGGTFVRTTTASEIPNNADGAFSWDSSAAAQTVTTTAQAIPSGWYGKNGVVSCTFKCASGTCTHTLTADDGTNPLATAQTITSSTSSFVRTSVNFIWPSSGNVRVKLASVAADEVELDWGACHLGLADEFNISQVSQATLVGSAYIAPTTNCGGWFRTNTAFGSFSSDADCPGPTVELNPGPGTIQTTDTDLPKFTVNDLPPGNYEVVLTYSSYSDTAGTAPRQFAISDGTTRSGHTDYQPDVANTGKGSMTSVGVFSYTSSGNRTFELQARGSSSGNVVVDNGSLLSEQGVRFIIKRFPTTAETAYRPEQVAWYVDANISGANPSLGTADQTAYTGIENGSLTLTNNTGQGTITAQIPCSSTNSPSGTTCSAGNESVGVSFNLPKAGDVLACVSFSQSVANGASGYVYSVFQIVETPANAQTISQEGKSRIMSNFPVASSEGNHPHRLCGTFTFSSAGQKTLRLFYEQDTNATVSSNSLNADAAGAYGQNDIHWEVYPISQTMPMPILVGGVTAPDYAGATRINTIVSKSGNYTATDAEETIVFTADATLTLPAAASFKGKKYHVVASGSGVDITIDPNASETVCGKTTIFVGRDGDEVTIQSNGTNWIGLENSCFRTNSASVGNGSVGSPYTEWISWNTRNSAADYTYTIITGAFPGTLVCDVTHVRDLANTTHQPGAWIRSITATSIRIAGGLDTSGNSLASDDSSTFFISCSGPR